MSIERELRICELRQKQPWWELQRKAIKAERRGEPFTNRTQEGKDYRAVVAMLGRAAQGCDPAEPNDDPR